VNVAIATPAQRPDAIALIEAVHPELAPMTVPAFADVVVAVVGGAVAGAAIVHRDRSRLEFLAAADSAEVAIVLGALLEWLRARGVRTAMLRDHAGASTHHAALLAGGFAAIAATVVVRADLSALPPAEKPWVFHAEREIGEPALRAAMLDALSGTGSPRVRDEDPLAAFARDVTPAFRARWWSVAALDGEHVGVVLPQAHGDHGVSLAFIGLRPAWRGRALSADLLAAALARFAAAGARWYLDEADVGNTPALHMLARVGCIVVGRRTTYAS